jgi:gluconolactonase
MTPELSGRPTRVTGVPPEDGYDPFNLEGPVWVDGALYLSEMASADNPPPARILKYTPGEGVVVWKDDAGTNGLALDPNGDLYGAVHEDGTISRFDLANPAAVPVPIVSEYMGQRFSSPNDLVFRSDGVLYFTDPDYQADPGDKQPENRAYWFDPSDSSVHVIPDTPDEPNGIALSPDEGTLYVASSGPIMSYDVAADGSLSDGETFGASEFRGVDGMGVDCAGNLYAAVHSAGYVVVLDPSGSELGRIQVAEGVTNVAFGGAARTTLYITRLVDQELYELEVGIVGYPY